ncbi:MAG TPA: flagellar export protein FliJ [Burkholderiaceae bacterium]|nr:flagellar export protein FliJ [Burkholderiaceae bacterium]
MSTLKTLLLAVDLATRKRDAAMQEVAQAEQALAAAHEQMVQLEGYAKETETRWTVRGQISTTPELMRHHYQFMDRLSHAMELQKSVLRDREARVQACKAGVLQAEIRLASLKKVCEKKRITMAREQGRREQRDVDELAAAQHRNFSVNPTVGRS